MSKPNQLNNGTFVSSYNFEGDVVEQFRFRGVKINDTTLRDGEQTPGVVFTIEEKLEIAKLLDDIGVHQIEAGTPAMSPHETKAVNLIAKQGFKASVMGWARAVKEDIEAVIKTDADAVAISIATSDIHLKHKLKMSREQVVERAVSMVEYAKAHGLYVSLNAEDATRTDFNFLKEFALKGKEAGADRLRICDTVGVLIPAASFYLTARFLEEVDMPVEIHAHDDYGLAVANALASCEAGSEYVSTTVNGLGERAGNSSLESVIMSLVKLYRQPNTFKTSRIIEISRFVEKASGIPVPVNRSIVGGHMFTHESGIHVDGVLKFSYTYESFSPDEIGASRRIVVGKHSGKHAIWDKLREMGIEVDKKQLMEIVDAVKTNAEEKKRSLTDEELKTIALETLNIRE
jgi:homocitrate synthase NifV